MTKPETVACCTKCGRPFEQFALTGKMKQLRDFIARYVKYNYGVSPTFEEMKDAIGVVSKSGVHRMIIALEERGHIRRLPNRARSIQILKASK